MMPNGTEPEQFVERYRGLIAQLEMATHDAHEPRCNKPRNNSPARREWQGEDSLHEMAFGEP